MAMEEALHALSAALETEKGQIDKMLNCLMHQINTLERVQGGGG